MLYKAEIGILKILPFVLAIFYIADVVLPYYCYDSWIINYIADLGIIPLVFICLTSFIFKFCIYHRLPLYYIIANDTINIIDRGIGIPISSKAFVLLHLFIALITLITIIYTYVKYNKETIIKNYRRYRLW